MIQFNFKMGTLICVLGIFHFRFWLDGKWVDVVVDDFLPTIDGKLIFLKSKTKNEFWPALLEKAYAKINGSYQATSGGFPTRSMTDLCGGVAEQYRLQYRNPAEIFNIMWKAQNKSALMACGGINRNSYESATRQGLIEGEFSTLVIVIFESFKESSF